MSSFNILLSGICFNIKSKYELIKSMSIDYLTNEKAEYLIECSDEEILNEETDEIKDPSLLEATAIYRKIGEILPSRNRMIVHGSSIIIDDKGLLFTAKSGTGKSTHSLLYKKVFKDRMKYINDDKPIIEVKDNEIIAYGTMFNGKHHRGNNVFHKINSICFLNRGIENKIEKLDNKKVFSFILPSVYLPKDKAMKEKTLFLVTKLTEVTSFYKLECNMEDDAAKVSYEGMKNEN